MFIYIMSQNSIDYSNTIFYKIHCKDTDVKDIYIGHTTNFVQRKKAHRRSCICPKCCNHNCKVYTIIRQFGGWDNWNMDIIAFHHCDDHSSARKLEQQYFEEYNATLNSVEPFPTPKQKVSVKKSLKAKVITSNKKKHLFNCELCDFTCIKQSNFNTHMTTRKHQLKHSTTATTAVECKTFTCEKCNMSYKDRSGLWRHKKKCKFRSENTHKKEEVSPQEPPKNTNREIIDKLVTSNTEMKEMMLMLMKTQMQTQENTQEIQKQTQENVKEIINETLKETSRQNQELHKQTQDMHKQNQEATESLMNKFSEVLHKRGYTKKH